MGILAFLMTLPMTTGQDVPVFRPSADALSPSGWSEHATGVRVGWLGDAMLLDDARYVFVDDSARRAYQSDEKGKLRPLSPAEPNLPSTIRLIGRLSSGEIAAADDHRGILGALRTDGLIPGEEYGLSWRPVCVLDDGTAIGRSLGSPRFGATSTLAPRIHRNSVHFTVIGPDGRSRPIVGAAGNEAVRLPMQNGSWRSYRSIPVIFGHKTLAACSRNYFIVAQTDHDVARLFTANGDTALTFRLPGARAAVSADDIAAQRLANMSEDGRRSRIERRRYKHLASETGIEVSFPDLDLAQMSQVPANSVAPPVDGLFVDASDRIWFRLSLLPAHDIISWNVWDIGQRAIVFRFDVDRRFDVQDAYADRVLLRRRCSAGQDQLIVVSMIRETGPWPAARFPGPCRNSEQHANQDSRRRPRETEDSHHAFARTAVDRSPRERHRGDCSADRRHPLPLGGRVHPLPSVKSGLRNPVLWRPHPHRLRLRSRSRLNRRAAGLS